MRNGEAFIIVAIVVDDLAFASSSQPFLNRIISKLSATFGVKHFGKLSSFIGWDMQKSPSGIKIVQRSHIKGLMERHNLAKENGVSTPLPVSTDVDSAKPGEQLLDAVAHGDFRAQVGGFLYAAVCPGQTFLSP